jgi:16S rRNA G966 N2-methylase RsmD
LNKEILSPDVQEFINDNLNTDVHRIALSKSHFPDVSAQELAEQILSKKKCEKKLPTWFNTQFIYYPPLLTVEQSSSETTASYKQALIKGDSVVDLTGGFGVDSYYFAKKAESVIHCEINAALSDIAKYNASVLNAVNISFLPLDGLEYIRNVKEQFGTLYIDPARRSNSGKVFLLKDCTPNVVAHLDMLLSKAERIIIKTSPLLDISAGIKELKHVSEVQIISTRNECKELLFILDKDYSGPIKICSVAINTTTKQIAFAETDEEPAILVDQELDQYLYEPDVALLKSGKFNAIASHFGLRKLDLQSQLYTASTFNKEFPGRIFQIDDLVSISKLKKQKDLVGNVITRNYPEKPEQLIKQFKIKSSEENFLIFTKVNAIGYILLKTRILQYY